MKQRVCVICGKEFDFWHSKAKTCGKECSKKHEKNVKKLYVINNLEKVRQTGRAYYYKTRKFKKKTCKICGREFILRGAYAKTCSEKCRKENIRRNNNRGSKIWVKRHPERRKETMKKYGINNREKLDKYNSEWRKKNPKKVRAGVKRWRKKYPKKRNAQAQAQGRIKLDGKICEICNIEEAKHRHHEDYSKPLEVIFLCIKCHNKLHWEKKNGK
ncbi:MAG TPA: hypothetical protein VMZ91_04190 [Candidatus Paceibacterota bacterium]|nr:hypothetical protein [Candidatus Paceibacterota bacterium]